MAFIKVLLLNIFLLLQLSLFVASFYYDKPQILHESETIVESGDNFTVICQGNVPLTWDWPQLQEPYNRSTIISTTDVIPVNKNLSYATRIFIQNVTFPLTGFLRCHDKKIDPSDEDYVSKIYLYVKDEEHLSVFLEEVETIVVTQYQDAIIPCRPTSPDVNVQLTLVSGEKKENAIYDPKTGYRFNVTHLGDEEVYCCTFKLTDIETEHCVYLKVVPISHSIPKPILEEVSGGHTVVGEPLVLECKVRVITSVSIMWITPTGPADLMRMNISDQSKSTNNGGSLISQRLSIPKANLKDKGTYLCNVSDNQNHYSSVDLQVRVYALNEHFINLTEDNQVYSISAKAGTQEVLWRINVKGHPQPKLFWINNKNETILIEKSDKYEIKMSNVDTVLKIKDVDITDYGMYTLLGQNDFETKSLNLFLNVTDKPSVFLEGTLFYMVNQMGKVTCKVASYPPSTIYWFFKPCLDNSCTFQMFNETLSFSRGLQVTSIANIKSLNSGYIKCAARNSLGDDAAIKPYYVTDVKDGFDVFGFEDTVNINKDKVEVAFGESLKMVCGISVYNFTNGSNGFKWLRNNKDIENDNDRYRIDQSSTEYTDRLALNIDKVTFDDSGTYSCLVETKSNKYSYKNRTLVVSELSKPSILDTNMTKDIEMRLPNQLNLFCKVRGVPKPVITWYKNEEILILSNKTQTSDFNQYLHFSFLDFKDEGIYKCVAKNRAGETSRQATLKFKNKPDSNAFPYWIAITGLIIVVFIFLVCMLVKMRNERKLQKELEIAGLANFEKGAIESLNPELTVDDQAELLPYDKKWEFPIEKLKLGKQLGSGAFGVVMKGVAKGIVEGEESTVVAVKMVKKNADYTFVKALASELKIMVHLGKHLNVVNLIGACTKNVAKRELLVIVEFCRYGNLQNYLLRHRENFINQVDPKTSHIDYTIGQDILERTYSVSSNHSNTQSPYMKYAALSFSNSGTPDRMVDYRGDNYNVTTAKTDITTVSMSPSSGDEGIVLSNNSSVQPEWRSNYHGDYKDNTKPIGTTDLLAWAFQVSRGMEYLAARKVLHGDLAARNILLADNNVVKICDFGLAKSMYKTDNYTKKGNGPLPIKWMAIESIRDKVFSTQSDVWSFGIVLWEFFSLAKTPYPGMEVDEKLYNKLLDGYRMESPEYAPKEMYKMMQDCWHAKPQQRPTFTRLSERIGSLLEDTVRRHYVDLNDPYLAMNTRRLDDGHSDYLAMLSPPSFQNLATPHYANSPPPSSPSATSGYLSMDSHIFSPRARDDPAFHFAPPPQKEGEELQPMLEGGWSVTNPSYHLALAKGDNYVNLKGGKGKEVLYVNQNSRDWESVQL